MIFIDEIDSVGAKRVSTSIHPYANQTINQLLAEMDGFEGNTGVIVIGATNRRDDLDKYSQTFLRRQRQLHLPSRALLRPGRFDVTVEVHLPDLKDRTDIFELYLGRVTCAKDVDALKLAEITTGFTGADIENMVNTAAVRAAADGKAEVSKAYYLNARDKVTMGPERKNRIPDEQTNRNTAFHEAGHTLVAFYTKGAHLLDKVTIVQRGHSLGHTGFRIAEERLYGETRQQMVATIDVLMGGRIAEELIFGPGSLPLPLTSSSHLFLPFPHGLPSLPDRITTGAASDLQKATSIAQNMVQRYGMSDKVPFFRSMAEEEVGWVSGRWGCGSSRTPWTPSSGCQALITSAPAPARSSTPRSAASLPFAPLSIRHPGMRSEVMGQESYERARALLKKHADEHERLAEALLKYETLDLEDVRNVIEGRPVANAGLP